MNSSRNLCLALFCAACAFQLLTASAGAAPVRVGKPPRLPAGARALGPVPGQTRIRLTVALAPRDPAGLDAYAREVSTPGSAAYGRYLTVEQFAQRFGATNQQIAAVSASLRGHGLTAGRVSRNGLAIAVTPTAAQAAKAFSTRLERYLLRSGRSAFANTSAPALDPAAARLVQGVIGLDALAAPGPLGLRRSRATAARASDTTLPRHDLAAAPPTATADPSVATGGPQPCADASAVGGAYTADELASSYRFSALYGAGDLGAGQTIALYELESYNAGDIAAYQSCYGTSASVSGVPVDGASTGTDPGQGEAALDIEDVIGLAPQAKILVYTGPNGAAPGGGSGPFDTYAAIINDNRAKVISTSWGLCEPLLGSSEAAAENTLFQEAAVQGQSIVAASGDDGAESCAAAFPLSGPEVADPAAQPFVTGVGGTTLSALGPPPGETVWNDDPGATGGGISEFWRMSSYQAGAPASLNVIGADASRTPCSSTTSFCREVPDVSADADPFTGYVYFWHGSWDAIGGTSAAAPLWGALLALTNASPMCAGTPVGFANPALYRIAGSAFAGNFGDVTSGQNDFNGMGGFSARAGYDMSTGIGTPNGATLAGALCDHVTVSSPGDQSSVAGSAAGVRVTATSSAGTAVSFSATGLPAGLSIDPSSGVISGTLAAPGSSTVTVQVRDADGGTGGTAFQWLVRAAIVSFARTHNQTGVVGRPVSLRLSASVDNGRSPSYSARGLPPGLSIDRATGTISGRPTRAGRFRVSAAAADPSGSSDSASFRWTIGHALRSSRASLGGVARHRPRLSFTLSAAGRAAVIKTVSISLPAGLSFAARRHGIAVAMPRGARVRVSAAGRGRVLTLKLSKAVSTVRVAIGAPSLRVSNALARKVAARRAHVLAVPITAADAGRLATQLTLRLRPS